MAECKETAQGNSAPSPTSSVSSPSHCDHSTKNAPALDRDCASVSAESGRAANEEGTAVPPRRNRKAWTPEEQRQFWQRKKAEKKERQRQSAAARKAAQQAEWEQLSEEERERRRRAAIAVHEKRRVQEEALLAEAARNMADPTVPVLVFDLSFAWCMTVADTKSTVSQIKFSYSTLRQAGFVLRPAITSLVGKEAGDGEKDASVQAPLLECLRTFEGFRRFPPLEVADAHWSQLFPREKTVFLTADADDVLENLATDTVYIVGAFVDHNQYKGLSRAAAERHGVRMARLPIAEHIHLGNRCKVLTINHVTDVLARFMRSGRNWRVALEEALPVRRVAQEEHGSRKRRRHGGDEASPSAERSTSDDSGGDVNEEEKRSDRES